MNRLEFGRWNPTLVLAALTIVAVAATAAMLTPDEAAPPAAPAPARVPDLPALATYAPPPKEQFGAINERPLFTATRRPMVPEPPPPPPAPPSVAAAAVAPSPPPPASLRQTHTLVGIVEANGERTALLRANAGALVVRIAEGSSLQGWTLTQVGPDVLRVRAGAIDEVIEFPKAVPVAAPLRTPGAPQPMGQAGPAMNRVQ
jgi:hypothetical protein